MTEPVSTLIIEAELPFGVEPRSASARYDVRISNGYVAEVAPHLSPRPTDQVTHAHGAALIPGLHDHHLHLFALAASRSSVDCSAATTLGELGELLRAALPGVDGSVRATGYSDARVGALDRHMLDRIGGHRPIRVQHRSGALWILNSSALRALGVLRAHNRGTAPHPSLELDSSGYPTGRVWRGDSWLRQAGASRPPLLGQLGQELARLGITGVTDASPDLDAPALAALAAARRSGDLPQRLQLLGRLEGRCFINSGSSIPSPDSEPVSPYHVGPRKIVLTDHQLPSYDELVAEVLSARREGRTVAVHSVTLDSLVLLLAVFTSVPSIPGDRIEHAAVIPQAFLFDLSELGVTVVTQPGFIAHRGDELGNDLGESRDTDLYRVGSLIRSGIPLALSSDAPYGPLSPWEVMHAAHHRRTPAGHTIGVWGDPETTHADETIDPDQALARYLAPLATPGAIPRTISPGAEADVVLLQVSLAQALAQLPRNPVRATMVAGRWIHQS